MLFGGGRQYVRSVAYVSQEVFCCLPFAARVYRIEVVAVACDCAAVDGGYGHSCRRSDVDISQGLQFLLAFTVRVKGGEFVPGYFAAVDLAGVGIACGHDVAEGYFQVARHEGSAGRMVAVVVAAEGTAVLAGDVFDGVQGAGGVGLGEGAVTVVARPVAS